MRHTCPKVTLRQRAIRNGRISLYLDYYPAVRNPETMQMSRREYLGIYIYAHPKNEMEREFNMDMLNKAEAIRCIRVQSLINEEFGFLDRTKMKTDFLAYFLKMCRKVAHRLPTLLQLCTRTLHFWRHNDRAMPRLSRVPSQRQATQTKRESLYKLCIWLLFHL